MAKGGSVNIRELEAFKVKLEKSLSGKELDLFIESCAKELAARLLRLVIKRTPVGDYSGASYSCAGGKSHKGSKVKGKVGGTLRRGWTSAKDLRVYRSGSKYAVEIVNPVKYASYVEFGHRTRNGGWVEGHLMLKFSEEEIEKNAPKLLESKLRKKLKECFK